MSLNFKPAVLIILDGFGITMPGNTNAISSAKIPFFYNLLNNYPTMLLESSGLSVGLPYGEVGNSEVGHLNIGSGQLMYQSLPRINNSIDNGTFFDMELLLQAAKKIQNSDSVLHLMGLIGTGGVHAHQKHIMALLEFCRQHKLENKVKLHLFLDGRDTPRDTGRKFLEQILSYSQDIAQLASVSGRFYAMDRNHKWDRTEKAYKAIVLGESEQKTSDIIKTINNSYENEVYDEEFIPTVIVDDKGEPVGKVNDGDVILFFNFRSDRARQLTESFVIPKFKRFERTMLKDIIFISFIEYKKDFPVNVLYPPHIIENPLAKVISEQGFTQFHIAETEKYAHVTFFLNGLIEDKFPGEERVLIPSPPVMSYDEKPEMSAFELTDNLINAIRSDKYDFIVVNYANGDMVGHTGNLEASIKSIETIDVCLYRVMKELLEKNGICFIVGDHGNVEEMVNLQTLEIDKEHSIFPVPFVVVSNKHLGKTILKPVKNDLSIYEPIGILSDVAPTILTSLGLPKGPGMKGGLEIS